MTTAMMPYRFISTAEGNGTLTSFATSPPESDTTSNLAYLTWLMPVIFSILITVGVVGNTLVIYVIIKASKRTVTNYYIVNLAASDILFLAFCAPPTAAHYTAPAFYFGRFMCKTVYYLQLVCHLFANRGYFVWYLVPEDQYRVPGVPLFGLCYLYKENES